MSIVEIDRTRPVLIPYSHVYPYLTLGSCFSDSAPPQSQRTTVLQSIKYALLRDGGPH